MDAKYAGNKILQEQTQSDPYMDLQDVSKKGPRGPLRKSFDDCVIFHLLTVSPNNAAEQESYYLMDVLKKPQCVSVRQFVQRVEKLNSYIAHLPRWFYSPSVNPNTTLVNVPFTKADLASQVLWMCPLTWQDQFNLHKKGMTPVDMCLLLMSFKAIEHVFTQGMSNVQPRTNSSKKGKKGNKQPGTVLLSKSPRKFASRSIATLERSMGARKLCTI